MDAKVTWKQRLSFDGTANSGFSLPLGSQPQFGGDNDGFRPMELILLGLIGCTAMDVMSILMKKRLEILSFDVTVHAEQSDMHPKVFTHATIEYIIQGRNIDPASVEQAVELSETKYCSAQQMLIKSFPIEHKISIKEVD
ncbi:MAG: OsmC family protein [Anaerolineaceae bacterium]|nr:OsmC family protein [Anaerolineaceae bacterium]MBN2676830.1 OsmC family protein [Anaerolineaceae bacterium]